MPPPEEWSLDHPLLHVTKYENFHPKPLPKEIYKSPFTEACFEDISVKANNLENKREWEKLQRMEDPWCERSVRSEMIYGNHQDLSPRSLSMTNFEDVEDVFDPQVIAANARKREARLKMKREEEKRIKDEKDRQHLLDLSLSSDKAQLLARRNKGGLWAESYKFSMYTATGTALDGYKAKEREIMVQEALTLYYDDLEASGAKGVVRRGIGNIDDEIKASTLLGKTVIELKSTVSSLFSSPSLSSSSSPSKQTSSLNNSITTPHSSPSKSPSNVSPSTLFSSLSSLFSRTPSPKAPSKSSPVQKKISPKKVVITSIPEGSEGVNFSSDSYSDSDDEDDNLSMQTKCHHGRPIRECEECLVTVPAKQTKRKKNISAEDLKYMRLTEALGGQDVVENISENFLKFAEKIRKKYSPSVASSGSSGRLNGVSDPLLDVFDACTHGGVMRVITALAIGAVDVDDSYEGSPLFMAAFKKILLLDEMTNTGYLGAPEFGDRVKFTRILRAFQMYHATFNKLDAEGFSALHRAAEYNNVKMIEWCLNHSCDVNMRASHAAHNMQGATAFISAALAGRVEAAAHLARRGCIHY